MKYAIGLDYGTNSVRAVIVSNETGKEVGSGVWNYKHGDSGVITDPADANLARHHPQDYIDGCAAVIKAAIKDAKKNRKSFDVADIIGIGVDTTGSTPMPVDKKGTPLGLKDSFKDRPAAFAWLWKDHTSHREAVEITRLAEKKRPQYLAKCGESYSSEWFWAKILHCARVDKKVFNAAHTWVEVADWVPAFLTGNEDPAKMKRGICAAGHKAMYNPSWGGYADEKFLRELDPELARVRQSLPDQVYTIKDSAGTLTKEWARKTGLKEGTPVAVGAFDAHTGGIGAGIRKGSLVKIIGTSTCDLMVSPLSEDIADIPGLAGIVPESILPGYYGLEAGQSAVGDIFNWFVNRMNPGGKGAGSHEALTKEAETMKPGQSGLLALDWHNGNRSILGDQRLTGAILGLTLHTTPAEIYRALIEATAYGARAIMERLEQYGQKVTQIINCGGISVKNPFVMQIYADVMGRTIKISRSTQTSALGAAMGGAVVAGKQAGGFANFSQAAKAMTGTLDKDFRPIPKNVAVYEELYQLYLKLHNSFGLPEGGAGTRGGKTANSRSSKGAGANAADYDVMKQLLEIKDRARKG